MTAVEITNPGEGYTHPPGYAFNNAGSGSGATLDINVDHGQYLNDTAIISANFGDPVTSEYRGRYVGKFNLNNIDFATPENSPAVNTETLTVKDGSFTD